MIDIRVNEAERLLTMLEGKIEAYLTVQSQHLPGGIEKNHTLSRGNWSHDRYSTWAPSRCVRRVLTSTPRYCLRAETCTAYSSTQKIEAICSSETSVDFQ
jgi:hypothetical protein